MFSTLRTRYGIPGLIATVALVFAMTGGAFAAKYLITSTNQIKPSVLKKLKGAAGPAGAAGALGPAGSAGAKGDAGAAGANGTNGKDGVSVTSEEFEGKEGPCEEGGSEFTSAAGTTYACNGAEGPPGPITGALPTGVTLKGMWSTTWRGEGETFQLVPISFGMSLTSAPTANYIDEKGKAQVGSAANCPGTAAEPKANAGNLCLYAIPEAEVGVGEPGFFTVTKGGAVLSIAVEEFSGVIGSWAVTAP